MRGRDNLGRRTGSDRSVVLRSHNGGAITPPRQRQFARRSRPFRPYDHPTRGTRDAIMVNVQRTVYRRRNNENASEQSESPTSSSSEESESDMDSFIVSDEEQQTTENESFALDNSELNNSAASESSVVELDSTSGQSVAPAEEYEPIDEIELTTASEPASANAADESVIRSSEHGDCPICFDDVSIDPVGCIYCRKFVGCRKCIERWFKLGQEKAKNSDAVYSGENHFACPLCRHEWGSIPEVESIFALEFL